MTLDWVELVVGFACNCHCTVCPSAYIDNPARMTWAEMMTALDRGFEDGARGLWIGGGEPTLHDTLARLIEEAKARGFQRIRLQSNGLRLSYRDYAEGLCNSGLTEVSLLLLAARADLHQEMSQHPKAFELVDAAIDNLRAVDLPISGDVLVTTHNLSELSAIVDHFAERGISQFVFWMSSLHGLNRSLSQWIPKMTDVAPHLERAFERADERGAVATSLHTPPCVLSPPYRDRYLHAGHWKLRVVVPRAEPFMAEASPMEGGIFADGCASCSFRSRCLGLRADYLELYGSDEFVPVLS